MDNFVELGFSIYCRGCDRSLEEGVYLRTSKGDFYCGNCDNGLEGVKVRVEYGEYPDENIYFEWASRYSMLAKVPVEEDF